MKKCPIRKIHIEELKTVITCTNGVRSGHASHALHDQIFRDCMTNFCAMRHIFFNLMGNGTDLE